MLLKGVAYCHTHSIMHRVRWHTDVVALSILCMYVCCGPLHTGAPLVKQCNGIGWIIAHVLLWSAKEVMCVLSFIVVDYFVTFSNQLPYQYLPGLVCSYSIPL